MIVLSWMMSGSYWPDSAPMKPQKCAKPHPVGQWSWGPAAPWTRSGVRCHLPKPAVAYPFSDRTRGQGTQLFGHAEV